MTERGNKDAIRIGRVDDDGANLPRLAQAEMLPGFAGVDRFVDPVADREVRPLHDAGGADRPPPAERADRPPFQGPVPRRVDGLRRRDFDRGSGENGSEKRLHSADYTSRAPRAPPA